MSFMATVGHLFNVASLTIYRKRKGHELTPHYPVLHHPIMTPPYYAGDYGDTLALTHPMGGFVTHGVQ